jgi:ribonuclease-3 family protein
MEKGMTFKPENYAPLVLAYMGDAYIELLTRAYLIGDGDCNTATLNIRAKDFVTAVSQSAAVERILPFLTEEELTVYKQGRNAKSNHSPRSASAVDYRRATGLECLFGWLYFSGRHERAQELFEKGYISEANYE